MQGFLFFLFFGSRDKTRIPVVLFNLSLSPLFFFFLCSSHFHIFRNLYGPARLESPFPLCRLKQAPFLFLLVYIFATLAFRLFASSYSVLCNHHGNSSFIMCVCVQPNYLYVRWRIILSRKKSPYSSTPHSYLLDVSSYIVTSELFAQWLSGTHPPKT